MPPRARIAALLGSATAPTGPSFYTRHVSIRVLVVRLRCGFDAGKLSSSSSFLPLRLLPPSVSVLLDII